ncbi:MAG: hypothetical protein QM737_07460 [Ferruginibacter sp.]
MIKIHSIVLIICSVIGFTGHYYQFGVARLTPWIPATAGIIIILSDFLFKNRKSLLKYLPIIFVLAFGILTTNMCIRFLPQEFQPLRKKIIFSVMSVSAWATIIYFFGRRLTNKE